MTGGINAGMRGLMCVFVCVLVCLDVDLSYCILQKCIRLKGLPPAMRLCVK